MIDNSHGWLLWNAAIVADALGITEKQASAHFRDGRNMGAIIEHRLAVTLNAHVREVETGYVLVDKQTGDHWRVRRMTDGGVAFAPQKMFGTGRTFNASEFEAFVEGVTGFIIADVEVWPRVPYVAVPSHRILSGLRRGYVRGGKMERKHALEAFFLTRLF